MRTMLLTGGSGFLGREIRPMLEQSYRVHTLGLKDSDDMKVDLATTVPQLDACYDVVLHAAGKAHLVPRTEKERQLFFDVNYQGTVNLCKALEHSGIPHSFIFISTTAVYGCESGVDIAEDMPLKGISSYARSKIMAESYLQEWCGAYGCRLGILRPSLLAGHDAPGNLGSMVDGIRRGAFWNIAGGTARRSILLAKDIARVSMPLIEKGGIYNVCDSYSPTFEEIASSIAHQLGRHRPRSIPFWLARIMAKAGDILGPCVPINSARLAKMTQSLTFSNEKARHELGWEPLDVLTNFRI